MVRSVKTAVFLTLLLFFTGIGCTILAPQPLPTRQATLLPPPTPTIPPPGSAFYLPTITPMITKTATAVPSPTVTATPEETAVSLWLSPELPTGFVDALPAEYAHMVVAEQEEGDVVLRVGGDAMVAQWLYLLVTPFSALPQQATLADLQAIWQGNGRRPLLMESQTYEMLTLLWGEAGETAVTLSSHEELLDVAWQRPDSWVIIPLEALEPRWRVLPIDGTSPLVRPFIPESYPLRVPISIENVTAQFETAVAQLPPLPATNFDPNKMTTIAMTGVTALVRATAHTMEIQGVTYPALDIGDWLREADFAHVNNEVPFAENCPEPNPVQQGVTFCSQDAYIGLLEEIGTDIIELSGDHFQDWGEAAMWHTLELYEERGWLVYGGGANLDDGRQPILIEHNGNRIALIGCNAKGGYFARASDTSPGAAECDMAWMASEIERLRAEGYLVIATFQHQEYYTYRAQPDQQRDFRQMAEAGAVVVSGSQAHQPQGVEFFESAFIHYGLGNLFFDQYSLCNACREGMVDVHTFYDGRYIQTDLRPMLFIDYARPRPMTVDEQNAFFTRLFNASDLD